MYWEYFSFPALVLTTERRGAGGAARAQRLRETAVIVWVITVPSEEDGKANSLALHRPNSPLVLWLLSSGLLYSGKSEHTSDETELRLCGICARSNVEWTISLRNEALDRRGSKVEAGWKIFER